jgi:hypothetical protein
VWTAPCWQGLFWFCHEELVGSAHVYAVVSALLGVHASTTNEMRQRTVQ